MVWQAMGSNHRRLSRRFYSPNALPESPPADQHVRRSRLDTGPPPSAMRPWALDSGAMRATDGRETGHGRGRKNPRTAPVGAVSLTAPTGIPARTCHFRKPARCRRHLRHRGLARRPGYGSVMRACPWLLPGGMPACPGTGSVPVRRRWRGSGGGSSRPGPAGRRAVKPVTSTEWPACIFGLGKDV